MTDEKNFSAFPCAAFSPADDMIHQRGMTMRDWFAGMALQGLIAHYGGDCAGPDLAYQYADNMMKERVRIEKWKF